MKNHLKNETSPYLLQHADNPVNWYPWCKEAFEKAKTDDKPIFLSIGYSTCHWCHVMEHESFENMEVAEALNNSFVSIKVDREERPDIDAVYMKACQSMTGSGGWPLTILMTADQKPFYAATYLPKNSRGGGVGLMELLDEVARQWKINRKGIESAGDEICDILKQQSAVTIDSASPSKDLILRAVNNFKNYFDSVYGGFGTAPKFPAPHNLLFLIQYFELENDKQSYDIVDKTLSQMYKGGIFDHIGGGFSRYSTDRKWLVPHFEKMLYDNALLTLSYAEAYRISHKPIWEHIIRKTLDYVLREMTNSNGGFCCAQDADSEGVEGKYYVFTPDEIKQNLSEKNADIFCRWFGITMNGNFEGKNIPNLLENKDWEKVNPDIEDDSKKIYDYRYQRTVLNKDDKILTSWNALMIAAFAKAGFLLDEPKYLLAAEKANRFIFENLLHEERLYVSWRNGKSANEGQIDDYAFYAFAQLTLYECTFHAAYLQKCIKISEQMLDLFFDSVNGGFYLYSSDRETLIDRPKETYDGAMPSGNSVAAFVLGRLAKLTGELKWQEACDKQLGFLSGVITEYPIGYSFSLLAMTQMLYPSYELLCVTAENCIPPSISEFVSSQLLPNMTVLLKTPQNSSTLEDMAPFTKDYPIPESGTAFYFCKGSTCAKAVYSIENLKSLITEQ